MNPSDPLAQLNPLREPALLGWWPPAHGWWLLLALLLLGLCVTAWLLYLRHRRNAYRRLGLVKLDAIFRQYNLGGDTGAAVSAINALLKSLAPIAHPRRDIASVSG